MPVKVIAQILGWSRIRAAATFSDVVGLRPWGNEGRAGMSAVAAAVRGSDVHARAPGLTIEDSIDRKEQNIDKGPSMGRIP